MNVKVEARGGKLFRYMYIPFYCLRIYRMQCMHNINLPIKLNARLAIAFIVVAMVSRTGAQCATRMLLQAPSHFRMLQR